MKLGQEVKRRPKLWSPDAEAQDTEAWPGKAARTVRKPAIPNLSREAENKEETTEDAQGLGQGGEGGVPLGSKAAAVSCVLSPTLLPTEMTHSGL